MEEEEPHSSSGGRMRISKGVPAAPSPPPQAGVLRFLSWPLGSAVTLSLGFPVPSRTHPASLRVGVQGWGGGKGLLAGPSLSQDVLGRSDLAGTLVLLPPPSGASLSKLLKGRGHPLDPPAPSGLLSPWPDYRRHLLAVPSQVLGPHEGVTHPFASGPWSPSLLIPVHWMVCTREKE